MPEQRLVLAVIAQAVFDYCDSGAVRNKYVIVDKFIAKRSAAMFLFGGEATRWLDVAGLDSSAIMLKIEDGLNAIKLRRARYEI